MKYLKLFLRIALATAFLSAVADRLGMWPKDISAWGNWENFLGSVESMNPWFPDVMIPTIGFIATAAELLFGLFILVGFKTELFARLSGMLLLIFALSITFTSGIKGAFDYSVFTASAAAFALAAIKAKHLEIDTLISNSK